MALKNQNIAKANPSAIANLNYINALYKEAYNRNATKAELDKFSGKTVKDAANLILGQSNSPFASQPSQAITPAPTPQSTETSSNIVQVKDKTGNTINVYKDDIPALVSEGSIPEQSLDIAESNDNNIQSDIPTEDNQTTIWDSVINSDAFLAEQFKDANLKNQFNQLSPTLQAAYIQMLQSLGKTVESGKVVNPNIEITPEKVAEFTSQATSELDPYYQEQIKNYQADLDTSIKRLSEDFSTGVRNAEEPFKLNLAAQAESEAQAGLTYSSSRNNRLSTAVNEQQQKIDELAKSTGRNIQDAYTTAERSLGSNILNSIAKTYLPNYNVSSSGFNQNGTSNVSSLQGNLAGTINKEKTTAIKSRASELEEAYRQQRILNTNL